MNLHMSENQTLSIKEVQFQIDVLNKDLEEFSKNVIMSRSKADGNINYLEKETMLPEDYISNLFRPENSERKDKAIAALKELVRDLDEAISDEKNLASLLSDLKLLLSLMEEWKDSINTVLPVLNVIKTYKVFKGTTISPTDPGPIFVTAEVVTGIIFLSIIAIKAIAKTPIFTLSTNIAGTVLVVLYFLHGIFVAEKRKEAFEKIKVDAASASKEIKEISNSLKNQQKLINDYFQDIEKTFKASGLFKKEVNLSTSSSIINALSNCLPVLRKWKMGIELVYNNAERAERKAEKEGKNLPTPGDIASWASFAASGILSLEEESADVVKLGQLLQCTYYYSKGKTPEQIATLTDMKLEEVMNLYAHQMLLAGKQPNEIVKELNIPLSRILQIQDMQEAHLLLL